MAPFSFAECTSSVRVLNFHPYAWSITAWLFLTDRAQVGWRALHCIAKILLAHDVVAIKNTARLVATDSHGDPLRYACADHVANRSAPKIVLRWHTGPHEKVPMNEHLAYVDTQVFGGVLLRFVPRD